MLNCSLHFRYFFFFLFIFLFYFLTLQYCIDILEVCCCHLVTESYLTLCDPLDCSPPGSSVSGILQARILEWVAISFSRGSSQPRDQTHVSCTVGGFFTSVPPGKPLRVQVVYTWLLDELLDKAIWKVALLTEPEQIHKVLGTAIVQMEKSSLLSLNQQVRGCSLFPPAGSASFWPRALSHFFRKSPNEMNSSWHVPGKASFSRASSLGSNRRTNEVSFKHQHF